MKNLINMLLTTLVMIMALFLIDDDFGIVMLFIWLIFLCLSFIFPLFYHKSVQIQLICHKSHIEKGDTLPVTLIIHNTTYLPTPLLTLQLMDSPYMKLDLKSQLTLSLAPREVRHIELNFLATSRGLASIGLDSGYLHHLLGLKYYRLLSDYTTYKKEITILPKLHILDPSHQLIKHAPRSVNEDEELGSASPKTMQSHELDFACRPYDAGDALSKIHWKQSAKSSKLMVRKNLETSLGSSKLILDFLSASYLSPKAQAKCEGELIENFLSLGLALYKSGIEVELCFFDKNKWYTYKMDSIDSFWRLQSHFATYAYLPSPLTLKDRLHKVLLGHGTPEKESHATVFTHAHQSDLTAMKAYYLKHHITLHTVDPIDFKEVM